MIFDFCILNTCLIVIPSLSTENMNKATITPLSDCQRCLLAGEQPPPPEIASTASIPRGDT